MAKKKNKKIEDIFEKTEIEPIEGKAPETEPVSEDVEAVESDADLKEDEENSEEAGYASDDVEVVVSDIDLQEDEENSGETGQVLDDDSLVDEEISTENLLEDVRRSLIEENIEVEEEKKPSLWQKLGIGRRKTKASTDTTPVVEMPEEESQPDVSGDIDIEPVVELQESTDESIDDLIEMLATDEDEALSDEEVLPAEAQVAIEEEQPDVEKVDVDELKKRAFQGSAPDDKDEDFSDVRAVALDDNGEEVFVEVEVKAEDPREDRIKAFENALRPYRRYINFGIAFIGIVAILAVSVLLFNTYKSFQPQVPTPTPSNLPYPVMLNIVDGGFSFNLGRGSLEDGRWNPKNPEWLEGTEVCRWVAILYSRPLEAALRTLTQKDQLELEMSNGDVLTYDVYSITQMSIEDMQKVSSNTPCLLLVLADANTDTRLVVTAYPH